MDNKKTGAIVLLICVVMIVIIIYSRAQRTEEMQNVNETENQSSQTNIVNNETKEENIVEEKQNEVEENTITENKIEENITKNEVKEQVQGEEETKDDEAENAQSASQKALELVKEEWGEDDTVYYTIDNESGSIFNISVRSKETTAAVAEYEVNVKENTVNMK